MRPGARGRCRSGLPRGFPAPPAESACSGRIIAFSYDDRGRCDGFVLEVHCAEERGLEGREPEIEAAVCGAFAPRFRLTIVTAPTAPLRPLPIFSDGA